jgi:hypothetical protein
VFNAAFKSSVVAMTDKASHQAPGSASFRDVRQTLTPSDEALKEQVARISKPQFNPLAALNPRSADFNDDVTAIADAVILTPPNSDARTT